MRRQVTYRIKHCAVAGGYRNAGRVATESRAEVVRLLLVVDGQHNVPEGRGLQDRIRVELAFEASPARAGSCRQHYRDQGRGNQLDHKTMLEIGVDNVQPS